MIYLLHLGLAVTAFLVMLNDFLRGIRKYHIDAFLSIVLVGLLVTAFVVFGWKAGTAAIFLAFVYAAVSRPIAARAAARLHSLGGGPTGTYDGLPGRTLGRISRELGCALSPGQLTHELLESPSRRDLARAALLDHCVADPALQPVMVEFGADRSTLDELYHTLCAAGAGQWAGGHFVAASAVAYPQTLRFLLGNYREGLSHSQQAIALIMHFERGAPLPPLDAAAPNWRPPA